jgi:hypothetical protein
LTRFANYFVRHWRGGFSLGLSFWVNGLLALFSLRLLALVQRHDRAALEKRGEQDEELGAVSP